MLTQAIVDQWLEEYKSRMLSVFGDRIVYIGCQGSWARGEGTPESDIDAIAIIDRIEPADLMIYRDIISQMPHSDKACGVFWSLDELRYHEPRCELVQFYYGMKTLHGSMDTLIEPPTDADIIAELRFRMGNAIHAARHYLLYPHDISLKVHQLYPEFKYAPLNLRWWILLTTSTYHTKTSDLISALTDPLDKGIANVSQHWKELERDRTERPESYIELLEQWARSILRRLI